MMPAALLTLTLCFIFLTLPLGFALPGPSPTTDSAASTPTASTKNGTYEGLHLSSYNQDIFLGIPFAQPPLGALRFSNPQSLNTSFTGVKPATKYYPECVGYGGDDIGYEVSEDCLALNVVTPSGYSNQTLPVAVWIHGGGLIMGGTVDRRYNLSFIVENSVRIGKPIIGVSIAYRLAAWGFLYSAEVQGSGNVNLGLKDQRLALHWIQENIGAFGGDPAKVTIWGESAGAASVGFHLVAYGGRDDKLFRAGIMESGNPVNYVPFLDASQYQPGYDMIVKQTGCAGHIDTLNCLRSVPYNKLNIAFNQSAFNGSLGVFEPVIDGDFIQKYGSVQLADGDFVHVPIISGANSDEGTAFGPLGVENTTQWAAFLESPSSETRVKLPSYFVQEILKAYPDNPSLGIPGDLGSQRLNATYGKFSGWCHNLNLFSPFPITLLQSALNDANCQGLQYRRTSAYAGDEVFIANRRLTCATWASASVPAYCFRFNVRPAGVPIEFGATHFQEVAFVFNNINGLGYAINPFKSEPNSFTALSKLMSCSWASFVHDLDPNSFRTASALGKQIAGEAAAWPMYGVGKAAQNIVWDANVTSHAEPDTFRATGIALINTAGLLYHR